MTKYMNSENEKLNSFLEGFEDALETSVIPLILGIIVCVIFNFIGSICPLIVKISFIICGYAALLAGIILTVKNYKGY